jgi:ribosome recycling factor
MEDTAAQQTGAVTDKRSPRDQPRCRRHWRNPIKKQLADLRKELRTLKQSSMMERRKLHEDHEMLEHVVSHLTDLVQENTDRVGDAIDRAEDAKRICFSRWKLTHYCD